MSDNNSDPYPQLLDPITQRIIAAPRNFGGPDNGPQTGDEWLEYWTTNCRVVHLVTYDTTYIAADFFQYVKDTQGWTGHEKRALKLARILEIRVRVGLLNRSNLEARLKVAMRRRTYDDPRALRAGFIVNGAYVQKVAQCNWSLPFAWRDQVTLVRKCFPSDANVSYLKLPSTQVFGAYWGQRLRLITT